MGDRLYTTEIRFSKTNLKENVCLFERTSLGNLRYFGGLSTGSTATGCAASGNTLYIATGENVQVYDLANPANPLLARTIPAVGTTEQMRILNGFAYLAVGPQGLRILDLNTPSGQEVLPFRLVDTTVLDVAVQDRTLCLSTISAGTQVYDLSDPRNPQWLANTKGGIGRIALAENWLWATDSRFGLQVYDIADRVHPRLRASYFGPAHGAPSFLVLPEFVAVEGRRAR